MFSATAGATIYYTLDGTDPTTASPVYPTAPRRRRNTGVPITGRGVHTLKAMAVAPSFNNSPVATATYTIR
jgi:hypothetical protein